MALSHALACAAQRLVGTPFRLQGRDPATGLDCMGLVIASLLSVGVELELPADYRPRRRSFTIPTSSLHTAGLIRCTGMRATGDILLVRSGPAQVHLAIATYHDRIVHAHAGLGRVVSSTFPAEWAMMHAWRLAPDGEP